MGNKDTREHMIESTSGLVHRLGFHGTSLNEILTESGAPRGSLYYHFPGGKEQLILEATRQGVAIVTQVLKEALADSPDPADGVRAFVEAAAYQLRDSGYVFGCPVAPSSLTPQSLLRWPRFARRLWRSGNRCWPKDLAR